MKSIEWTRADSRAASKEGWNLWDAGDGLQLQRIDCPDEGDGELPDDDAAWRLVWDGTKRHHLKALAIIYADSAETEGDDNEWLRIVDFIFNSASDTSKGKD